MTQTASTTGKGIGDANAQPPVGDGPTLVLDAEIEPPAPAPPPSKALAKVTVPVVNGICKPDSIEGIYRVAEIFYQAKMLPGGVTNIAQMMVALMAGIELGLSPSQAVQNIMVVNNRPTVWGDAALALVRSSGLVEDIEETLAGDGETMVATCRVKRRDTPTPTLRTFSVADARAAGLWTKAGPWKYYPKRMLQLRARAFALRDSCPEVLKGLGIYEEAGDYEVHRTPKADKVSSADDVIDGLPQHPTTNNGESGADLKKGLSSPGSGSASSAASAAVNGKRGGA